MGLLAESAGVFGADSFISRLYPAGRQAQAEGGARAHEIGFGRGFGALWGVGGGAHLPSATVAVYSLSTRRWMILRD